MPEVKAMYLGLLKPSKVRGAGVLLTAVFLSSSCSSSAISEADAALTQGGQQLKIDMPAAAAWVPYSFKLIDERARLAKLDDLKSIVLQKDDLEVRVWGGFGVSMLQGHLLKRTNGRWWAAYIPPAWPKGREFYLPITVTPKSGWEQFSERLFSHGLLTLPDSTEQMDEYLYSHDGTSYVVEINMNKTYRTYHYREPHERDFPEAKRMAAIIDILHEELGRVKYDDLSNSAVNP